ncbi:MAG: hypothetical protein GY846_11595 [Deltaproteobacteria bacterium]|nr:hypothetical protein [Deltaproteobacteria bacterium]
MPGKMLKKDAPKKKVPREKTERAPSVMGFEGDDKIEHEQRKELKEMAESREALTRQ